VKQQARLAKLQSWQQVESTLCTAVLYKYRNGFSASKWKNMPVANVKAA
jgi:hypothetical protein